jgi:hypothetical protein
VTFKCNGNQYNISTVFKTKHTLRGSIMETKPQTDPQLRAHCECSIPCECGRNYVVETGKLLVIWPKEHRISKRGIWKHQNMPSIPLHCVGCVCRHSAHCRNGKPNIRRHSTRATPAYLPTDATKKLSAATIIPMHLQF